MTTVDIQLLAMTVNEVVRRYPATIAVFNRHGIDTCCGGGVPVAEAAAKEAVDANVLLADLMRAQDDAA